MEVPKISCQEGAEVAKTVPQDRLAERSQVVEVPKISCRVTAEVAILQRTVEQHLDTGHELASRCFERFRERTEQVEKESSPSFFVTM